MTGFVEVWLFIVLGIVATHLFGADAHTQAAVASSAKTGAAVLVLWLMLRDFIVSLFKLITGH